MTEAIEIKSAAHLLQLLRRYGLDAHQARTVNIGAACFLVVEDLSRVDSASSIGADGADTCGVAYWSCGVEDPHGVDVLEPNTLDHFEADQQDIGTWGDSAPVEDVLDEVDVEADDPLVLVPGSLQFTLTIANGTTAVVTDEDLVVQVPDTYTNGVVAVADQDTGDVKFSNSPFGTGRRIAQGSSVLVDYSVTSWPRVGRLPARCFVERIVIRPLADNTCAELSWVIYEDKAGRLPLASGTTELDTSPVFIDIDRSSVAQSVEGSDRSHRFMSFDGADDISVEVFMYWRRLR